MACVCVWGEGGRGWLVVCVVQQIQNEYSIQCSDKDSVSQSGKELFTFSPETLPARPGGHYECHQQTSS